MNFRTSTEKDITSAEILNQVNKCKPADLESLLSKIQTQIEKSAEKDYNLLMSKTMITSILASMRSK
jgi:hypothetical protein